MGNFHLEVYTGDEYLGVVRVAGRYAQMVIGSESYPFRTIEDACVALLALQHQACVINAKTQKTRPETKAEEATKASGQADEAEAGDAV